MPDDADRRGQVEQRLLLGYLQAVAAAFLRILLRITEFDAAPDAIEQAGCDGHVTRRRKAIRHAANVMVHAEDFLADHHGTARAAHGR